MVSYIYLDLFYPLFSHYVQIHMKYKWSYITASLKVKHKYK